jgi:hypothetical protein
MRHGLAHVGVQHDKGDLQVVSPATSTTAQPKQEVVIVCLSIILAEEGMLE